jgi:putative membrane protein
LHDHPQKALRRLLDLRRELHGQPRPLCWCLPMSYFVDGLRVTISGGNTAHLLRDVLVLAGFLVLALG